MIKALQESSIERIPELLVLPTEDPYLVLKCPLIELYNLSDYEMAELLMALPQVNSDMPLHAARQNEGAHAARGARAADQPLLVCFFVETAF